MSAPGKAEIEAEVAAMAAERLGGSLADDTEWASPAVNWGSDGPVGWIELEGGLRLRLTVELTGSQ